MVTEKPLIERFVGNAGFHRDVWYEALCDEVEMTQKRILFLQELDS